MCKIKPIIEYVEKEEGKDKATIALRILFKKSMKLPLSIRNDVTDILRGPNLGRIETILMCKITKFNGAPILGEGQRFIVKTTDLVTQDKDGIKSISR